MSGTTVRSSPRRCAATGESKTRSTGRSDVTFGEDQCRIRKGHADVNFSLLRRAALGVLKNNATEKVGVKNKRLCAAWDDYRLQVLCGA